MELKTIGLVATQTLVTVPCNDGTPVELPAGGWVPLVKLAKPGDNPLTEDVQPVLSWHEDRVERGWAVVTLSARKQAERTIAAGYTVQPEGFTLSLDKADRNSLDQMVTLVQLLLDRGDITGTTMQKVADKSGALHEVTTDRFLEIIVAYGVYFKTQWDLTQTA